MKDGSFFQAEPGDSSPDMSLFQCPPVCFSGVLFSLLVQFPTCPVLCLPQELTWVFRSGPPAGFSLSGFSQVPIGLASDQGCSMCQCRTLPCCYPVPRWVHLSHYSSP